MTLNGSLSFWAACVQASRESFWQSISRQSCSLSGSASHGRRKRLKLGEFKVDVRRHLSKVPIDQLRHHCDRSQRRRTHQLTIVHRAARRLVPNLSIHPQKLLQNTLNAIHIIKSLHRIRKARHQQILEARLLPLIFFRERHFPAAARLAAVQTRKIFLRVEIKRARDYLLPHSTSLHGRNQSLKVETSSYHQSEVGFLGRAPVLIPFQSTLPPGLCISPICSVTGQPKRFGSAQARAARDSMHRFGICRDSA
ncbi:oligodendrocyte transcription factor 3 [Striga asiatica]|uniref:Oligodendrocyte transcription factor 3 n=1 Tax=Striga asiatica TaxID=4170 RepID=A0A5A7PVC8_STRAF|nr:oligodendrocyte transcription factor 3 [Striga asiatica]